MVWVLTLCVSDKGSSDMGSRPWVFDRSVSGMSSSPWVCVDLVGVLVLRAGF